MLYNNDMIMSDKEYCKQNNALCLFITNSVVDYQDHFVDDVIYYC